VIYTTFQNTALTHRVQNPDAKPDYRSKTLHELEKLQSNVILLNDMLDNFDTSKPERFAQGDAYDVCG
jgi:ADP-ribosylation factor-binding protein GGA